MKVILSLLALISFLNISHSQREEYGLASFYSDAFHGKPTASGELYDKDAFTAAHKELPFGTMLKITRLDNLKSVQVRVNDRGPHISGRVVDVSKAAALALDLVKDGSAKVVVEVANSGNGNESTTAGRSVPEPTKTPEVQPAKTEGQPGTKSESAVAKSEASSANSQANKKSDEAKKPKETPAKGAKAPVKGAKNADAGKSGLVKGSEYQSLGLYKIQLARPEKKGFGIQVAALSSQDALFRKIADLQEAWFDNILVNVEPGAKNEMSYKVILGPFPDNNTATSYKENLKKNKKIDGFVVDLAALQSGK
jgi:rare lipoprotein A